ncbi:MAG: DsbA family protein [Pedobacter sp.]|nr:MAG: DsbA family protein [Pedobacter sp.]
MSLKPALNSSDHIEGGEKAKIEIVEFGDYQCPHCGAAYPIVKEILDTFGNQIKFVFRNFPLSESHQYAEAAALAAEAAALQHKFWEMHDAIYERQSHLSEEFLKTLAKELDLDLEQFDADMGSDSVKEKVESDFESGIRSGVNGTPTFFVNGERFDGGAMDLYQMLKESTE